MDLLEGTFYFCRVPPLASGRRSTVAFYITFFLVEAARRIVALALTERLRYHLVEHFRCRRNANVALGCQAATRDGRGGSTMEQGKRTERNWCSCNRVSSVQPFLSVWCNKRVFLSGACESRSLVTSIKWLGKCARKSRVHVTRTSASGEPSVLNSGSCYMYTRTPIIHICVTVMFVCQ